MFLAGNLRRVEHGSALHEELPPQLPELLESAWTERLDAKARFAQRLRGDAYGRTRLLRHRHQAIIFEEATVFSVNRRAQAGALQVAG